MLRLRVLLLVATACLLPWTAHANGRFPASNAVVFDPHDPKTIYTRTTFGLLVTHDGGVSWRWICERAIGFSGMEDPSYVVTPTGTLVAGTFSGVSVSRDRGCSFTFVGERGTNVLADATIRANGEIVGISSLYRKGGESGSAEAGQGAALFDDHLVVSNDDARSFSVTGGRIDPTLLVESIEIAASDPARLYMTAVRGEGKARTAAFVVSTDRGASWKEHAFPLSAGETAPFVAAVDPKNADRVYVRTAGAVESISRLLVTDDAGSSWRRVFESPSPLLGFALSEDGGRVYVGAREGVSVATTDAFSFTKGAPVETQCLGLTGTMLWACSTERSGFVIGTSRNGGKSFDAKLRFEDIGGPLECPEESSVAKECSAEWPKLRRELGLPDVVVEKPRGDAPRGPALRDRAARRGGGRGGVGVLLAVLLVGAAGYSIVQRLRKR